METETQNGAASPASAGSAAGAGSLRELVRWQRATLQTESGAELPCWILSIGERRILTAVSASPVIEPVTKEDRKLIGALLSLCHLTAASFTYERKD